jgi:hypothetical protein
LVRRPVARSRCNRSRVGALALSLCCSYPHPRLSRYPRAPASGARFCY